MIDAMKEIGFLDSDDKVTDEGRVWYLDVCEGRIDLHPVYAQFFDELRQRMMAGTFYESATMAYLYEFARVQGRFAAMVAELEDED